MLENRNYLKVIYLFHFIFYNEEKKIKNLFNHKNINIRYVRKWKLTQIYLFYFL